MKLIDCNAADVRIPRNKKRPGEDKEHMQEKFQDHIIFNQRFSHIEANILNFRNLLIEMILKFANKPSKAYAEELTQTGILYVYLLFESLFPVIPFPSPILFL